MEIIKITLIVLFILDTILTIENIDKPREPISRGQAIFGMIINAGIIYWLLSFNF